MSVFLLRRSLALSGSTSVEFQGGFSGLETIIRVHVGKWVRSKFWGGSMHCGRRHLTKRLASYICSHLFSNQGNKNKIIQTSKTTLFQQTCRPNKNSVMKNKFQKRGTSTTFHWLFKLHNSDTKSFHVTGGQHGIY